MELCLRNPRQFQLLSRILSCKFSALASSVSIKPVPEIATKIDVSSVWQTNIDLNDKRIIRERQRPQYTVPFVFPRQFDHQRVVSCQATEVINATATGGSSSKDAPKGRPSKEQVELIYLNLCENIPKLFVQTQDFRIYDPNMVFEDNIRNKRIVGLQNYAITISLLKMKSHLKYSHVKMNVLRATQHPEEGSVKIRWRIVRSPGLFKMLGSFWKYNLLAIRRNKTATPEISDWVDGFSIFYINDQGKIFRHVCDKMMPDDDKVVDTKKTKLNVAI